MLTNRASLYCKHRVLQIWAAQNIRAKILDVFLVTGNFKIKRTLQPGLIPFGGSGIKLDDFNAAMQHRPIKKCIDTRTIESGNKYLSGKVIVWHDR